MCLGILNRRIFILLRIPVIVLKKQPGKTTQEFLDFVHRRSQGRGLLQARLPVKSTWGQADLRRFAGLVRRSVPAGLH